MTTRRRLRGISAVIVAEYLAAAVAVIGVLWVVQGAGTRPDPTCLTECGPNAAPIALAAYGLMELLVGLPIAFLIALLRRRRDDVWRGATRHPVRPPEPVLVEATTAAWRGALIGFPLMCLVSGPLARLLF
jgi:hypothetical protein